MKRTTKSNFTEKTYIQIFAAVALLFLVNTAYAQINPVNIWQTIPGDLNVCADSSDLEVRMVVFNSAADNAEVTVTFPPGTFYVPGSIVIESAFTNNGLSLVETDISNPNSPVFSITPANLTLEDSLAFRIRRYAGCDHIGYSGNIIDEISIAHDGPTPNPVLVNSLAYNINSGLLTPQYTATGRDTLINITGAPSQEVCRAFSVTQGDIGVIKNPIIHRVELGPDIVNYELNFNGMGLTPDSMVGQFLYYTIALSEAPFLGSVGDGDDLFENGEAANFRECFQVNSCSQIRNSVTHVLSWGCQEQACQVTADYTGSVAVQGSAPSLNTVLSINDHPMCLNTSEVGHLKWHATNPSMADGDFRFELNYHQGSISSWILDECFVVLGNDTTYLNTIADISLFPSTRCLSDGIGRIQFPFSIPAGATLEINGFFVHCCPDQCNTRQEVTNQLWLNRWGLNTCSGSYDYLGAHFANKPGGGGRFKSASDPFGSGDVFLEDGESATYCVEYPAYQLLSSQMDPTTSYIDYRVELPKGMMFSPGSFELVFGSVGGLYTATPDDVFMNSTMDTVTLRYPVSEFSQPNVERLFSFCFEASLDCSKPGVMSGINNINYSWEHNPNPICDPLCIIPLRCDDTYEVVLFCPGTGCPEGGGLVSDIQGRRINIYSADPDSTRRYIAGAPLANPSDARTDRLSPGDTLCISLLGRLLDGTSNAINPFIEGRIAYDMSWGQAFEGVPSAGSITLGGINYTFSGLLPSFTPSGTEAGVFHYDVSPSNLNVLNPLIPANAVLQQGDLVELSACFRFRTNDLRWLRQGQVATLPSSFEGVDENRTYMRFELSTDGIDYYSCNFGASAASLVSVATLWVRNGVDGRITSALTANCREYLWGGWDLYPYRGRLLAYRGYDFYPNEFRPIARLDTVYFEKKPGFDLTQVWHYAITRNETSWFNLQQQVPLPFTDMGDRYRVVYTGFWEDEGGPLHYYEDNARYAIRPLYINNCELDTITYVEISGNAIFTNPERKDIIQTPELDIVRWFRNIGNFSYIQAPFIINATSKENDVLLIASNEDARDINYTWVQIVPNPDVDVTNVSIGGVDMVFNPAGFWETGAHPSSATRNIELSVRLNSCTQTDLEVIYGWNCMGYPDAVDATACNFDTIPFIVQPINSQISLNITDQPGAPLDLCEPYTVSVDYASVFQADIINPGVEIEALPGLSLNEVRGRYPGNTGVEEVMPISVLPNGNWYIDFTDHSAVTADSLPGVISNPMPDPRLFQLETDFGTSCDFNPGQRMRFIARGFSPCGDPAIRAGQTTFSSPILINNANPYQLGFDVIIDQNETPINGCGGGSATLNVEALVLGGTTTDADTIIVELPAGVMYQDGSFNCSTAPACPAFSSYDINPDGSSVLKLKLTDGVISFTPMNFSFDIQTSLIEACSDSLPYRIRNILTIDNLACMGSTCDDPINSILGEYNGGFDVKKTEPLFRDTTICRTTNGTYEISGEVEILGFDLATSQELVFHVYCPSDPSTSIGSYTISGPLSVGDIVPVTLSITDPCNAATDLLLRFEEADNCVCEPTEVVVPIVIQPLAEAGEDRTICSTTTLDITTLGAGITPLGTAGLWVSSGTGVFDDGAGVFGVATTYVPSQEDILAGQVVLTLIPEDPTDYCLAVSDFVTITILKVDCGSFPWQGN